jgi:cytochrome c peroxidase
METSADGTRAYISSLWSRRLTIVDVPQAKVVHTLSLPFAPRELIRVAEGRKLIVADAFAGRLAIVDANTGNLDAVRQLPAHNIRGLALSPNGRKLLVAHQILNDLAETTHNDVHWGVLMSNVVRWLSLDRVLDPAADILADSHVHLAGDSNTPGADPSGMAMTPGGTAIVALAGGNELGLVQEDDYSLYRVPLGRRPTAVVATSDGRRAYVANTFDDSISLVDVDPARVEPARVERTLRLGEMPRLTLVDKGELLFYDASLSSDGWFSCHSCHTDGHTNGLLNDNLGDNSFGAAKRVLSLLGVAESAPWAWNGSVKSLETQIHKSIRTTMQGREPSGEQIEALAAYLKSLPPPPSLAEARGDADQAAIARGQKVFDRLQCVECHAPPAYTDSSVYDVGLADRLGNRTFNPPSLLGVSQRDRYFHDNRAENLEEVFGRFQHKVPGDLARQDLDDLLWFLQSL